MSRLMLLCVVMAVGAAGNLIRGKTTDDSPVFAKASQSTAEAVVTPMELAPVMSKCAAVGEFCMNHSDCCSNACLGYRKRCVSG